MNQNKLTPILIYSAALAFAPNGASAEDVSDWRIYSEEANGDVYFFDASRVKTTSASHTVWQRIQYKTSVMAASSYQSLLEVDCSERTERTMQRTFFSDKNWEKRAMSTDAKPKRKRKIKKGSANERLFEILCDR